MAEAFTPIFMREDSVFDLDSAFMSPATLANTSDGTLDNASTIALIDDGEETDDETPNLITENRPLDGNKANGEAVIAVDDKLVACIQNGPVLVAHDGASKIVVKKILAAKVCTCSPCNCLISLSTNQHSDIQKIEVDIQFSDLVQLVTKEIHFVDLLDVILITASFKNKHLLVQIGTQFNFLRYQWDQEKREDVQGRVEARIRRA
jgi:hypothetical protein